MRSTWTWHWNVSGEGSLAERGCGGCEGGRHGVGVLCLGKVFEGGALWVGGLRGAGELCRPGMLTLLLPPNRTKLTRRGGSRGGGARRGPCRPGRSRLCGTAAAGQAMGWAGGWLTMQQGQRGWGTLHGIGTNFTLTPLSSPSYLALSLGAN